MWSVVLCYHHGEVECGEFVPRSTFPTPKASEYFTIKLKILALFLDVSIIFNNFGANIFKFIKFTKTL